MATVLERFKSLGLAHSNKVLIKAGCIVAEAYRRDYGVGYYTTNTKEQIEDGVVYHVNDYPEEWMHKMDSVIISWINTQK